MLEHTHLASGNAAESSSAPTFKLRVEHRMGATDPAVYNFQKACVTIGRLSDNDIVLPSTMVSRRHLEIHYADRAFWLVDVKSRNTTKVEGHALNPNERYVLLDGDSFEVGGYRITFLGLVAG